MPIMYVIMPSSSYVHADGEWREALLIAMDYGPSQALIRLSGCAGPQQLGGSGIFPLLDCLAELQRCAIARFKPHGHCDDTEPFSWVPTWFSKLYADCLVGDAASGLYSLADASSEMTGRGRA